MDKENQCCDMAAVERGIVTAVSSGKYTVKSYGRDGLITPGIPALHAGASYAVNDKVYFFLFNDGTGAIIGTFT